MGVQGVDGFHPRKVLRGSASTPLVAMCCVSVCSVLAFMLASLASLASLATLARFARSRWRSSVAFRLRPCSLASLARSASPRSLPRFGFALAAAFGGGKGFALLRSLRSLRSLARFSCPPFFFGFFLPPAVRVSPFPCARGGPSWRVLVHRFPFLLAVSSRPRLSVAVPARFLLAVVALRARSLFFGFRPARLLSPCGLGSPLLGALCRPPRAGSRFARPRAGQASCGCPIFAAAPHILLIAQWRLGAPMLIRASAQSPFRYQSAMIPNHFVYLQRNSLIFINI